jgi:hypothetical protein
MLKNLEIHDFRGFHRLRIPRLGRVNLLVGTNNSGKTSILEAVDILTTPGAFSPIRDARHRRGEVFWGGVGSSHVTEPNREKIDVRHLFRGHTLGPGGRFSVSADADQGVSSLSAAVVDRVSAPSAPNGDSGPVIEPAPRELKLSITWVEDGAL